MSERITDMTACAKEIAQVLEKHGVTIGNMESALEVAKDLILSSTLVHVE